eukprot:SM006213S19709  [mRNA]  locus=s6213:105:836:- [translate_table: standard]
MSGTQPQFRYTQPPSKVLHVRNLPWECTEDELVELCKPFGKILNTKLNVGANHNQAFVEFVSAPAAAAASPASSRPFSRAIVSGANACRPVCSCRVRQADINQAIAMVSYYASSSEPAQVRGKAVYLQYSTRQEIVTTKQSGDVASNVLLVTIEGVEAGDVSIDVLHLVSRRRSERPWLQAPGKRTGTLSASLKQGHGPGACVRQLAGSGVPGPGAPGAGTERRRLPQVPLCRLCVAVAVTLS